ncbi:MAG: amidotransferase 1, exosortase A system-associated [Bacteroidia bacterium]
MCGIAGITGPLEHKRPAIEAMTQALAHRGPDAAGYHVRLAVALGHRRLSIIDLSDAGTQPMSDPSGRYTIVYNGELYNFREIKPDLADYPYTSGTDTEVILAAYQAWGPACLARFNGMFAFAIWDEMEQSLFIARDRLGIKPLYYYHDEEQLLFASEVRSILRSGLVAGRLDRDSLSEYLRYYTVHAPRTLLEGISLLPPGHWLHWQDGHLTTEAFWSLDQAGQDAPPATYAEACTGVRERLYAAVERRLMSDVPFGAFLSGGIDSSAIVALMATASDLPVNTFSIVFDEAQYDESPYSSLVARKYSTVHHPLRLRPEDFLADLPAALAALDHPSGDGLNSYVVSRATKAAGFTVALSGLGGDELFGGYPVFGRYARLQRLGAFYGIPQPLRRAAGAVAGTLYRNHKTARLQELIGLAGNDFTHLYPVFRKIFSDTEIDGLLGYHEAADSLLPRIFPQAALDRIGHLPPYSQVSAGEISTYTQHVLLRDTDQMSMAHALEVRVPFFDHTLVSYALRIPDAYKQGSYPKQLLVDALGDLLPPEIVHRPKMGFMFPWAVWMRGELRELCATRIQSLGRRGIFRPAALEGLWGDFLREKPHATWIKVWMLVALEDWLMQNHIDA